MTEQETKLLQALKLRLHRIARANDDDFNLRVNVIAGGYALDVVETGDNHVLVGATGDTLEAAIKELESNLPDALDGWGYVSCE